MLWITVTKTVHNNNETLPSTFAAQCMKFAMQSIRLKAEFKQIWFGRCKVLRPTFYGILSERARAHTHDQQNMYKSKWNKFKVLWHAFEHLSLHSQTNAHRSDDGSSTIKLFDHSIMHFIGTRFNAHQYALVFGLRRNVTLAKLLIWPN